MKYSLNTTFDLLASQVGPSNVAATAHAAGVSKICGGHPTLQNADGSTSFGIGIGDYPVRVLDMADGFGTFANGGTTHGPYFVQQVTDSQGAIVYQHRDPGVRSLDPKVANDVGVTLAPVASWSGVPLADGRPSAAKTGTEGIQSGPASGQNSDAWMVGYTPQVSAAVWVGSGNSTTAIKDAYGQPEYGRDLPGRTWKLFMDTYLAGAPQLSMPTTQQIVNGDNVEPSAAPRHHRRRRQHRPTEYAKHLGAARAPHQRPFEFGDLETAENAARASTSRRLRQAGPGGLQPAARTVSSA